MPARPRSTGAGPARPNWSAPGRRAHHQPARRDRLRGDDHRRRGGPGPCQQDHDLPALARQGRTGPRPVDAHITSQLGETGYEAMAIDAVAARAHASKTTIYRRWPGKAELVRARSTRTSPA